MKKIQLNKNGEHLLPRVGALPGGLLVLNIGRHEHCDGWIDIIRVSETYQVLYCRRCNFRMLIPLEMNTWKKLEAYMSLQQLVEEQGSL